MQVQYSERDSDHGSNGVSRGGGVVANGVGLDSRERLAPPSSSSESLGEDLKSTYYIFWGNSSCPLFFLILRRKQARQYANKFRNKTEALMVVVFFLNWKGGSLAEIILYF